MVIPHGQASKVRVVLGGMDVCVRGVGLYSIYACICMSVCLSVCLGMYEYVCDEAWDGEGNFSQEDSWYAKGI